MAEPLVAVLAAGKARRFGSGKLDAQLEGKPLGQWVLDAVTAAGLAPGLIVTSTQIPGFAVNSGWRVIENPDAEAGIGSSLGLAARAAERTLLVLLADMPLIPPSHLRALAERDTCTATTYPGGKGGVPALFPKDMLPQLIRLAGVNGAGQLLAARQGVTLLPARPEWLIDVDRPADLKRVEAILRRG